jgi:stearoyl-CoA desaturase (delta-9 desaturase)
LALLVLGRSHPFLISWQLPAPQYVGASTATIKEPINSLAHQIGRQRYDTGDQSGNSFLLSLIALGEGWHNNHHHYPAAVRQGFYWWEIDPTYYLLKVLAWIGLIWDLKPVPPHIRETRRLDLVTEALP